MRLDKFTQKAQEAIFEAQSLAEAHNHAQIEPEHLLLALLQQADGVAPQVIQLEFRLTANGSAGPSWRTCSLTGDRTVVSKPCQAFSWSF
jgi:hypothetical protein